MSNQNMNNNNIIRGNLSFGNSSGMQVRSLAPMAPNNQVRSLTPIAPVGNQQQGHPLPQPQPQGRPYFQGNFQPPHPQPPSFAQTHLGQQHAQGQILANPHASPSINVSPASLTTPVSGVKRIHKPPSRLSGGSSGQGTASIMKTMELAPAVRGEKRKLPDNRLPEKVAAILPESALYTQLLEFESRMDAALARKKTDIIESLKSPIRAQKVLRIYVFNTFANQTEVKTENGTSEPPSWSLKITGRILEEGRDPSLEGLGQKSNTLQYPKFSSFVKKITIYLDQKCYPDNHVILWDSSRSPALNEGFEVKRKGNTEFIAHIRLEVNYSPEKFKLSPVLREIIGIEVESRPKILTALWQYVKVKKLQIPGDTSYFYCDPSLRKIFGEEKMKFSMVSQKLTPHLSAPGYIHMEHKVKLSGNCASGSTCYDVLVDVPMTVEKEMTAFLANLEKNSVIDSCDELISSSLKKIDEHRRRRAFFLGFSQSPAEFINAMIASQAKDLKIASTDSSGDAEKEHNAELYNQPWIEDAVIRYINRKTAVSGEATANK